MGAVAERSEGEGCEGEGCEGSGRISLSEIFSEHRAHVARLVRARVGREEGVEDLVQEVFLTAHRRLDTYDPRRPVRPWLAGIARRVLSDHFKRAHVRRERPSELHPGAMVAEPDQRAALLRKEGRALLLGAIDALRPEQREVWVAHEIDERPVKEIAASAGIPLQTAYARLSAARRSMERDLRRRTLAERFAKVALVLIPSWLFGKSSAAALVALALAIGTAGTISLMTLAMRPEAPAETQPGSRAPSPESPPESLPGLRSPRPSAPASAAASAIPEEPVAEEIAAPSARAESPPRRRPHAESPAVQAPSSLSAPSLSAEELSLLASARRSLLHDPARALAQTNMHRTRYSGGILEQERERLAIEALVRLGRAAEARGRAAELRRRFPRSAHLVAIEELLSASAQEVEEEAEAPPVGL